MKIKTDGESQKESNSFEAINKNAAGIDIGSGEHHRLCAPIQS